MEKHTIPLIISDSSFDLFVTARTEKHAYAAVDQYIKDHLTLHKSYLYQQQTVPSTKHLNHFCDPAKYPVNTLAEYGITMTQASALELKRIIEDLSNNLVDSGARRERFGSNFLYPIYSIGKDIRVIFRAFKNSLSEIINAKTALEERIIKLKSNDEQESDLLPKKTDKTMAMSFIFNNIPIAMLLILSFLNIPSFVSIILWITSGMFFLVNILAIYFIKVKS